MAEDKKRHELNPSHSAAGQGNGAHGNEYEREDLASKGVFAFMIGLAVTGVIVYFIVVGMYHFLDDYEKRQMTSASPLAASQPQADIHYIPYDPGKDSVAQSFKNNGAPMLEINERGQLRDFLTKQEDQLNSYGWIDEKDGVAHIPIERAMELMVERGIPVYPESQQKQGASAASENSVPNQPSSTP
jgi:hypothetical protein